MSFIGELIEETNSPITEEEMVHISAFNSEEEREAWFKNYRVKIPPYEKVLRLCEKHEMDSTHLFVTKKPSNAFVYYDFPVAFTIALLDDQYFEMFQMKERISHLHESFEKSLKEKDIVRILALTEDSLKVMLLNQLYWEISEKERYDMYVEIYSLIDYGHSKIKPMIVQDAVKRQPAGVRERLLRTLDRYGEGDSLTIYRGEGTKSISSTEALSWTTSLSVATFFAFRYDTEGKVFQATVKKEKVIDFLNGRHEEEVIVMPQHVENLQEMPLVLIHDEMKLLEKDGYIEEYCLYRNTYVDETDYHNPQGIHGVGHVKRVLFHCLAMARALHLTPSERAILANSAVFHDIGRKHDGHCTKHGKWSNEKLNRKVKQNHLNQPMEINYVDQREKGIEHYNVRLFSHTERKMMEFIIEYHCIDDAVAKRDLKKKEFTKEEEKEVWKLFEIFKDCDGLERVRLSLKELDVKYFRTDEAVLRLALAYNLMRVKQL